MKRRTASALMIVIACCGIAAAADLEVLPKGHPKKSPAPPTQRSIPLTPMHPGPVLPAPAPQIPARQAPAQQAPVQQPAAPALKQEAPTPQPSQQAPSAPQRLQSPETPGDQGKPAPSSVPTPAPSDDKLNDLQPPASPAPSGGESWWQKVVRNAPHCRTFSDGCRTCDATFTCSSMPIACQPKEFVCTDPASPPASK